MKMYLSELESHYFGLNFGRYDSNIDVLDVKELESSILQSKIDVCRIKVLGSDDKVFNEINELNYPFEIYNVNYYNILDFKNHNNKLNLDGFEVREVIDADDDEDFKVVLRDVISNKTWVEYDSFLTRHLMPEEKRSSLAYEYYKKISRKNDDSRYTGMLYKEKKPIGLFMGYFKENAFFGNLFGIVKEYRQMGYAKYFYSFMYEICKRRNVHLFENEVNIFNFPSQKSAASQNFTPKELYFNFTIYPFCNDESDQFKTIHLKSYDVNTLLEYMKENLVNYFIKSINSKNYSGSTQNIDCALIRTFVKSDEGVFVVAHFKTGNKITQSVYLEFRKVYDRNY